MYKLIKSIITNEVGSIEKNDNGIMRYIPIDTANTDYQAYLEWLAEGNIPLPPDEPEETP